MKHVFEFLAAAALACAASAGHADIVTTRGDTSASATYNRLLEDLSAPSAIGTAVHYDSFGFSVTASGTYTFMSTARFDNFVFLYSPSLNAAAPLVNAKSGNDDLLGLTTAGFAYNLVAGIDYVFVTTGFGNNDAGAYSNTFGGPGSFVAAAPPPAAPSVPEIVTYTGNTTAGPTFNRALEDLSGLSAIGTAVHYDSFKFRVGTAGTYTFLSTAAFDNFAFLYAPSLNALQPLTGAAAGNDDLLGLSTAGFSYSLLAGVDYEFVTTGFGNGDFGAFSNTIGGPGAIFTTTAVPEPGTWALMGLGLAALGLVSRRRARRSA